MSGHPISEAGKQELDSHLSEERREILGRAYEKHYADKNPGPFDAETIADAIAELHSESRASANVAEPMIINREMRLRRLRLVLDLYQLLGVLIGVSGIVYVLYRLVLFWIGKSGENSVYYGNTFGPAFLVAYLGFVIAFATWYLGRRLLQYRELQFAQGQVAPSRSQLLPIRVLPIRASVTAHDASRFLWEWQNLERLLKSTYRARFEGEAPNLRDALRGLEDIAVISNYESYKILDSLRMRNLLVHGDSSNEISTADIDSATEDIRELRRKFEQKLEVQD